MATNYPESKEDRITRLEQLGYLDPACLKCQRDWYPALRDTGEMPFAPSHKPSPRCESGKRPHCTCDACF
jgi:hypothetical protein